MKKVIKIKQFKLYLMVFFGLILMLLQGCEKEEAIILDVNENPTTNTNLSKKGKISKQIIKPFVSGSGEYLTENELINFSFHASINQENSVNGYWKSLNSQNKLIASGTIECLKFLDNKTAFLSGIVDYYFKEENNIESTPTSICFKVIDNGEGKLFPIDQFSGFQFSDILNCSPAELNMENISSGNIQIKNDFIEIRDENFKEILLEVLNGDLSKESIENTTILDLSNRNITDLTGIEHFTNLSILNVSRNQLISLDVSNNTALTILNCSYNPITKLTLFNPLTSSKSNTENKSYSNPNLKELDVSYNELTELDISRCHRLEILKCNDNYLKSLDVSSNINLTELFTAKNQISVLNISNNINLTTLRCGKNLLEELNVDANTKLTFLTFGRSNLTSIDLSNNPELVYLRFDVSELTSIDLSNNPKLVHLRCNNNKLKALDISLNLNLKYIFCRSNSLTCIKVNQDQKIENYFIGLDCDESVELSLECN